MLHQSGTNLLNGYEQLPDSTKKKAIEAYLNDVVAGSLPVLPYDARAASWHASERARLTAIGKTPSFVDGQIAAIAAINDLTLVTANISDYAIFSDLRVENWKNLIGVPNLIAIGESWRHLLKFSLPENHGPVVDLIQDSLDEVCPGQQSTLVDSGTVKVLTESTVSNIAAR